MLTTEVQEKIIGALLKRPENQYCSDCNGKSPCCKFIVDVQGHRSILAFLYA